MKRYRFVIYALKDIAGLKAVETKGESLVMWVQKYEPGTSPARAARAPIGWKNRTTPPINPKS